MSEIVMFDIDNMLDFVGSLLCEGYTVTVIPEEQNTELGSWIEYKVRYRED